MSCKNFGPFGLFIVGFILLAKGHFASSSSHGGSQAVAAGGAAQMVQPAIPFASNAHMMNIQEVEAGPDQLRVARRGYPGGRYGGGPGYGGYGRPHYGGGRRYRGRQRYRHSNPWRNWRI